MEINSKTSYLVFMTPVSALSIILSKMLTVLVLGVILAAALGALGWLDFSLFLNHYSVYKSMGEVISEVMKNFGIDTAQVASMALFGVITFLLSVFSTVAMLYLCITLAATLLQNLSLIHILDVSDNGILGYIEIPKIKVSLPIYHGTDEGILQIAVGHIEGSSLPVGGPGTHAVLSGHRGRCV